MIRTDDTAADFKTEEIYKYWVDYKSTGNVESKNEILVYYINLVKRIVRRMMPKYNKYNEFDDLVNCGVIGLIDAVEKYSLDHGVKFEIYAVSRIRGEILDYMRSQDWAPPSLRKKINAITDVYEVMEGSQEETVTEENVAEALDMPVSQVQKILAQSHMFNLINFEDTLSSCNVGDKIPASEESAPEGVLLNKELKKILAELIDTLPEKERLVITLYYYEGLLLKEIAEILGVSESRVSQIHSKVLLKMKTKLEKIGLNT